MDDPRDDGGHRQRGEEAGLCGLWHGWRGLSGVEDGRRAAARSLPPTSLVRTRAPEALQPVLLGQLRILLGEQFGQLDHDLTGRGGDLIGEVRQKGGRAVEGKSKEEVFKVRGKAGELIGMKLVTHGEARFYHRLSGVDSLICAT